MMKKIIFSVLFLMFLATGVSATSIQQYNKILLTPYVNSFGSSNQNMTIYLNVNPPDNIQAVNSAILNFEVFSSNTYAVYVNNKPCNTPTFTASSGNGQVLISFDCTNVITKAGNYTIQIKPNANNLGTFFGWLDLTYMSNPTGTLGIHGTEYQTNSNGKIFLQLLDSNNLPVNNGYCFANIYYPNNTLFYSNLTMFYLSNSDGLYYHDIPIYNDTEVYMISARCQAPSISTLFYASNFSYDYATNITGNYTDTWALDGVFHSYAGNLILLRVMYNFTNISYPSGSILNLNWYGTQQYQGIAVWFDALNFSSNAFQVLPNSIAPQSQSIIYHVNNVLSPYFIKNGVVNIRIRSGVGTVYTDFLNVEVINASVSVAVKGSGEMHVSDDASSVNNTILSVNSSLSNQISQTNSSIMNYLQNTLPNAIASAVWNYFNRTLTAFGFPLVNITNTTVNVNNVTLNITNATVQNQILNITNITVEYPVINVINDTLNITNITVEYPVFTLNITNTTVEYPIFNITNATVENQTLNLTVQNYTNNISNYTVDLSGISGLIDSLNNSVVYQINETNSSIFIQLLKMQNEMLNMNQTLINTTLNITIPTTMNLTGEAVSNIGDDVILKMLANSRILNREVVHTP
jgi:hypothetical protein